MAVPSIKNVLVEAGLTTAQQFERCQAARRGDAGVTQDTVLALVLQASGLAEEVFLQRLAQALGWPFVDRIGIQLRNLEDDLRRQALAKLSTRIVFQYSVIPIDLDNGRLRLAVCNPFDPAMLSAVQFEAKIPVLFALAPKAEIDRALKENYGVGAETFDEMAEEDTGELDIVTDKEIAESDQDASVIKFVNQIIYEAHLNRATDIHFEPMEERLRIRYRIDGMLYEQPLPPQLSQPGKVKHYQASIISRVKVMSGMNIAEKRLPQDGRINVKIKGQELDIRVSTVPTVYGESVSLRLLTRGRASFNIANLGLSRPQQGQIEELLTKPHGIFLVTGPTGSGKSTSLYCFLSYINDKTRGTKRILTVEEPVEYEIAGVNQIAVRPEIGLTFAMGLRHILRQDPNVVMVGEIRDLETAEIAIRAALTGHLVFSTLHTNDAPSAFTRLIDMGIEPFLVASSVEAIMAQRLVRTICPHCKTEQPIGREFTMEQLRRKGFPEEWIADAHFYFGTGCDHCRSLGYQGRTGIYELLMVTDVIRPLILDRTPASGIAKRAIDHGLMQTLRLAGWRKTQPKLLAEDGVSHEPTTIQEVVRVTQSEEHMASLMDEH